jgi:hypothetical protein
MKVVQDFDVVDPDEEIAFSTLELYIKGEIRSNNTSNSFLLIRNIAENVESDSCTTSASANPLSR